MKTITHYLLPMVLLWALFFTGCQNGNNLTEEEKLHYTNLGNSIVKKTFDTLSKSLKTAIAEVGIEKAVSYCQINAYPITDTYASDSVIIRRTSFNYRNPANKPDAIETRILNFFAEQKKRGVSNEELHAPTKRSADGVVHFYKPILLQAMCSSCHGGKPEVGRAAVWTTIDSLYPLDKAYNYEPGALRGMWHVQFTKK